MGITEVTVPKQYVLVQTTEPTGAFEGQLWYDSSEDLTYIFQDNDWQLITLDISQEVLDLATENATQQIDIIELQANASVTPFDHDTLLSDTFSDADGYKDSVNTTNTTATFDTNLYKRENQNTTDLITDLIRYYKFDETTGTDVIDTTETQNQTSSGATINETGILNKSYLFNTSGNYVTLQNSIAGLSTGTISLWFKKSTHEAGKYLISHEVRGQYILCNIETTADGKIKVSQNRTNGSNVNYSLITSNTYSTTDWNHLVFKWGATGMSLTLNNTETTNETAFVIPTDAGYTTYIGRDVTNLNTELGGYLDELGIWDARLTADDITKLYNDGDGLSYDNFSQPAITETKTVEIDLPTVTGTVTHTELVTNSTIETGASITYKLNNGTTDDTEETPNTKNAYNLTGAPTKLKILLNPKEESPTSGNPSIKSYCLKLWKA